ncbi:MAG: LPXTG cell wall anchor domain-containing protein, partial [Acutalibacteraceae bacterium]
VESDDVINRFSFTVKAEPDTPSEPDIDNPQTGNTNSWKIWVYLSVFAGLTLIITFKKRNKIIR